MTHEITKHQCDFCGRNYSKRGQAVKHETELCFWNPDTRSCVTCENLIAIENSQHWLEGGEDVSLTDYAITCSEDHGMDWEEGKQFFVYQTKCPYWKLRTTKGEYKFGRVSIRCE